jgi:hypothetical protein
MSSGGQTRTTPLQYLILIQHEHILPVLSGRVIVPPAVVLEQPAANDALDHEMGGAYRPSGRSPQRSR